MSKKYPSPLFFPDPENPPNAGEAPPGPKTPEPIVLTHEGKTIQFADVDELKTRLNETLTENSSLQTRQGEFDRLKNIEKLAKGTVMIGDEGSEIAFYKSLGLDDTYIAGLMKGEEGGEKSESSEGKGEERTEVDIGSVTDEVLKRLAGNISLNHFDKESLGIINELAERTTSASQIVEASGQEQVEKKLAADPLVSPYWKVLTDRQKSAALKHVLKGTSLTKGRFPKDQELAEVVSGMRNWLPEIYGNPEDLRTRVRASDPGVMDFGETVTGLEGVSEEELDATHRRLNTFGSPEGKKSNSLANRMRVALEKANRKTGKAR